MAEETQAEQQGEAQETTPTPADVPNHTPQDKGKEEAPQGELAKTRREAARYRVERNKANEKVEKLQAEMGKFDKLTQAITTALGITKDGDETPTVEDLTTQLEAKDAANKKIATEYAVYKAAAKAGANPDRLLDSRTFTNTLNDLDTTDTEAVEEHIKTFIQKDDYYQARPQAGQSTVEHAPARKQGKPKTVEDLNYLYKHDPTAYAEAVNNF